MYKNVSCLSINNTTWFLVEHVLSLKHNHGTKNKTVYVSWEHQPTHWSWVLEIPCCTPFPNWTRLRWPIRTHKSNTSQTSYNPPPMNHSSMIDAHCIYLFSGLFKYNLNITILPTQCTFMANISQNRRILAVFFNLSRGKHLHSRRCTKKTYI